MNINFKTKISILCLILLSSCVTTPKNLFSVYIDSINSQFTGKKVFWILPAERDVNSEDLQFKEYASYVKDALISQGFISATSLEKADVAVFIAYGISDPLNNFYSYSTPIYGQTGVSSSYTSSSGYTTYMPSYGVVGSKTKTGSYSTYFKYLILYATDLTEFRKTKKEIQLWKTIVTSENTNFDLRLSFPIMLETAKEYLATNTGSKVKVVLSETTKKVTSNHIDDELIIDILINTKKEFTQKRKFIIEEKNNKNDLSDFFNDMP